MVLFNPALQLLFLIISCYTDMLLSDCPRLCECKWKSGKESVICWNASLSVVPLHLDAGTQVLDLTANNIVAIKHDEFSLVNLLNLQKIYISKCRLKSLDRYAFRGLMNLVELDLSYNVLSTVPSHVFDSIPELRELKLSGNPIQRISNDAFIHVPQLMRLELSECKIGTIDDGGFHGLEKSLEWLKLDKNKLVEVASSSLTILENLHGLELAGNPWNCSCSLRPLREWMLRHNVPFGVPPICQYPKRLTSKPWDKLDLDEFACVPEIFAYDSKAQGVEGKNITMTCRIAGIPEPNVRWLLKNKVIANLSGNPFSNGKKLYIVHLNNNASDLTILTADLQDAGVYVCAAENKAGRAEASVTLAMSKRTPDGSFSNKLLITSVVTGTLFVLASCLTVLCVCTVRKKQMGRWRRRECRGEDAYEKIELNHKASDGVNGRPIPDEISIVGAIRKNGEYHVVPGADTDQEAEEDEDNIESAPKIQREAKFWKPSSSSTTDNNNWNTPEDLLDSEDLHIPRRTRKETRDDFKRNYSSTSGTYNLSPSTSSNLPHPQPHSFRNRSFDNASGNIYNSGFSSDLSSLAENDERKYPDLIENSSPLNKFAANFCTGRANSEGGSLSDITELFCTLPRKRALIQNSRYRSSDSQSPLLPESRCGSSGGDSSLGSQSSSGRRLSDSQKYSAGNLSKNRVNQKSSSYLNLSSTKEVGSTPSPIHEIVSVNATPLLDVSSLESRVNYNKDVLSPTSATIASNVSSYDYHAAQLERFLEEYRTLQKQLTKMKETCDSLRQEKSKYVDPLLQSSLPTPSSSDDGNPTKSVLKRNSPVTTSPNSNTPLNLSICNYESDLSKYLISKNSPKTLHNSGVFNN